MSYSRRVFDDLTGQPLPDDLVDDGKKKELSDFESKELWELATLEECRQRTGRKPISTRWVCTSKGDHDRPNARCRLVARQIRHPGTESVFAPTPPLEALRTVLSCTVTQFDGEPSKTWEPMSAKRMQLSFVDISRAYFNAWVDPEEPTYVELPPEVGAPPGMCVAGFTATCTGHRKRRKAGRRSTAAPCASLGSHRAARAPACFTTSRGAS